MSPFFPEAKSFEKLEKIEIFKNEIDNEIKY